MKKIIIDLDNTLTVNKPNTAYNEMPANVAVIERLRYYASKGYEITVFTARGMRSYSGDKRNISKYTLPVILTWLKKHDVPYDQVIIGKPWCSDGFYVDDRSIRPDEFINMNEQEILNLIEK